ncbi:MULTISPECIES: lactate 2-monooxygenase [unclassified Streptomyces]|uniref:lactate 2-monooxygenase n=1 Tax=unclassified Streptomyces TaxID=2593676 RepID=UPI0022B5F2D0|nr:MULTISPECIES: lactate 2-monooxygenase [unclassified Streptomyces]MCZ7416960.1 lactate 2-monooxygenase [Streptomyces sp. WMMC897]MCZ7433210.1 lactate 2-monooxygenase [Streptomyces sp. WMMC1477]
MTDANTPPPAHFSDHQSLIYFNGAFLKERPALTTDLANLEVHAAEKLDGAALGYIVPSAGSGSTARANVAAFERWRVVPRMLRDHARRDLSATVLGSGLPAPVLLGPVGVQKLAHPEGELATARAAAALGLPYIHSTQASHSIEEAAEASGPGPRWYQLYWPRDPELCVSLLRRARAAGYTHLVITLDTTMLGWRPADLDRGYLPFLQGEGIANYTSDPVFRRRLEKESGTADADAGTAGLVFADVFPNTGLSWDELPFIREHWDGPVVLKGIQCVPDAELAVEHGMDGIVVSNHGGRQIDGAIASLDALPAIAEAVGDRTTVLFDSGVRTGADVFKALALGADAVLLGRPYLYGLALAGQAGVEHVLRCLLAELDLTLGNAGYRSHRELTPEALWHTA